MRKLGLTIMASAAILLTACGEKTYEPHDINHDTDICKICNMSIVHDDFAGQIIEKNGDYEVFDDIGCLVEKMQRDGLGEQDIGAAFIKDTETNEWINIFSATYLYDKDFFTPMNYGVLVFNDEKEAQAYQQQEGKGTLMKYQDLADFKWGIHQ